MDFIDLKIFQKLYISRNLTQVSRELYLSQPTLSYRLNRLRDELDAKLYHYDGRFHFTESGRKLYEFCERALKEHDAFISRLEGRNIARIDLSAAARRRYLEPIYSVFGDGEAFPIIRFTTSDEALSDLLDDQAMLSVVGGLKNEPDSHEFTTIELERERIVLVYNDHLLDEIEHIPILNDEIHSGLHEQVLSYLEEFQEAEEAAEESGTKRTGDAVQPGGTDQEAMESVFGDGEAGRGPDGKPHIQSYDRTQGPPGGGPRIVGEVGTSLEKLEIVDSHPVGTFVQEEYYRRLAERYPHVLMSEHYGFERRLYALCNKKYEGHPVVKRILEVLPRV